METAELVSTKTKWVIDPSHSEIGFKIKHLMITNVKGLFKDFGATICTEGEEFRTSDIDFWINPGSIDTGDEKRDTHLKGVDFFDFEHHSQIAFKGISSEKKGDTKNYTLHGDLTMKGITKRIKLDVQFEGVMKDPYGNKKAGYSIEGKINRHDWGLNWNVAIEAGGVLVSDEVKISCEVQLILKP